MSVADEIAKLAELHRAGELTTTEYEEAKRQLLATSPPGYSQPSRSIPAASARPPHIGQSPASGQNRPAASPPPVYIRKKKSKGWIVFGCITALIVIIIAISAASSPSPTTHSHKAEVTAFSHYISQLRSHIRSCTAAASVAQLDLGQILAEGTTISQAALVSLDTATRKAQTACDASKDHTLLDVGTLGPTGTISSIKALSTVDIAIETWASTDTTHVLHDLQNMAETSGSATANLTQLKSDITHANVDATQIDGAIASAGKQIGVKTRSAEDVGLVKW